MKHHKGFTLIELLVVVAIIGILATVIITALGDARKKARDARRHQDIKQIQTALEVYYAEHGRYPGITTGIAPNTGWANSGHSSWSDLEAIMGVTLPRDPINFIPLTPSDWSGTSSRRLNYGYVGTNGNCPGYGQVYYLVYRLEKGDVPLSESPGVVLCNGSTANYGNGSITVGMSPMM